MHRPSMNYETVGTHETARTLSRTTRVGAIELN